MLNTRRLFFSAVLLGAIPSIALRATAAGRRDYSAIFCHQHEYVTNNGLGYIYNTADDTPFGVDCPLLQDDSHPLEDVSAISVATYDADNLEELLAKPCYSSPFGGTCGTQFGSGLVQTGGRYITLSASIYDTAPPDYYPYLGVTIDTYDDATHSKVYGYSTFTP